MANTTTLRNAHIKFVENLRSQKRASATVIAYRKDIEQVITHLEKLAKLTASDVETVDLKGFLDDLAAKNYTAKSISRKINSTRTFFKYLKVEGIIKEDPASTLTHPQLSPKAPRILTVSEYRALRDAARNDVRTRAVVEVLLQTGIRIGEVAGLRVQDFKAATSKKNGELTIAIFENRPSRNVPLNLTASEAVAEYIKIRPTSHDEHLFITKTGRPLLIRNIRATIDRYFKEAGITNAKVNDLRHTFITFHLSRGVSLDLLSKIAGHKRISTTEKYLAYVTKPAEEKQELEAL
ncbi:MAG: tyrosine-type recombinase/integrase [candidate division WWE3 bacterium]|nr:tyrosine-type recombinase/integrase [candidate division WWE3 bacterium]